MDSSITADVSPDGNAVLRLWGFERNITTTSIQEARNAVVWIIATEAQRLGRPLVMQANEPEGSWALLIHPNGAVEEVTAAPAAPPPPAPEPEPEVEADEDEDEDDSDYEGEYEEEPAESFGPVPFVSAPPPPPPPPLTLPPPIDPAQRTTFLHSTAAESPAESGWRGAVSKVGLHVAPNEAERSVRSDTGAVSQHWPGRRTIAVANGKGGVGKTPTVAMLAAVFARLGGAGVLAWDNNQTRGTLGWRTEQSSHTNTVLELRTNVGRLLASSAEFADMAQFVHHQSADRYDVLRSKPTTLAATQRFGIDDVDLIHQLAAKYYRLILMDSGNDESDPMWLRMIDHTDQLVVPTTTRGDHAEAGALLLDDLRRRSERDAHLANNAVVVVTIADPRASKADVSRVTEGFTALARSVVVVPHDPAIVDGPLRFDALRSRTQRAWLRAAAEVASGLS